MALKLEYPTLKPKAATGRTRCDPRMRSQVRDLLQHVELDDTIPALDGSDMGVQLVKRQSRRFGKLDPVCDVRNCIEAGRIQCSLHRPAPRMATDDNRRHFKHGHGVLKSGAHSVQASVIRRHDIPRISDDKQFADPSVRDLGRDQARVRAGDEQPVRSLALGHLGEFKRTGPKRKCRIGGDSACGRAFVEHLSTCRHGGASGNGSEGQGTCPSEHPPTQIPVVCHSFTSGPRRQAGEYSPSAHHHNAGARMCCPSRLKHLPDDHVLSNRHMTSLKAPWSCWAGHR